MVDNNLVCIQQFHSVGNDQRGQTSEFKLPRNQNEFIYITRLKGSISGNTYHTGKTQATNPKVFVLISGNILLTYRKIGEPSKQTCEITSPAVIEISPYVTHQIEALSDFVILECNSIKDIQDDRIKEAV